MRLDDRPRNVKSYSGSRGLCRNERLEDTILVLTLYPYTRVFNGDHNPGRFSNNIGADPEGTRTISEGVHGLNGIYNQIQKYLLQLASICKQLWKSIAQLSCDQYSVLP